MPFVRTRPIVKMHPVTAQMLNAIRRRARGMGQDSSSTDVMSVPSDYSNPLASATIDLGNTSVGSPGPSTWQSFLANLPGLTSNAVGTYLRLQNPSLVPGTGAIYNPSTGTYYNPGTGQVVSPTGQTAFGGFGMPMMGNFDPATLLMIGGLGLGAILLISAMGKH